MINSPVKIENVFDSELFRNQGHVLIDLLADYLQKNKTGECETVLPDISINEMMKNWNGNFKDKPSEEFSELFKKILVQSNHLHNPKYIGHQVSAPLPLAALCDLLGRFLNNASAIYEMGMTNTAMEKRIIEWMTGLIYNDSGADGVLTSGGTIGNLTALLAARQAKTNYDVWSEGIYGSKPLGILVSEYAHYSISRAISIMGLGEKSMIKVGVKDNYQMDLDEMKKEYDKAIKKGINVIALVGNAGSTATGTYDDLDTIGDFCKENNLWFHVDGAHGASAIITEKYRTLLKGIEKADSIVWDAHKMMMMPALITAVLFKKSSCSYESFSQKASYLFEKDSTDEWYNYAHRTIECTKTMMGMKLYVSLLVYGTQLFSDYITEMYDLTKEFSQIIKTSKDFELAVEPDCNIICFRYLKNINVDRDEFQKIIRKKIIKSEKFYICQTQLKKHFYLRCTVINPLTRLQDLEDLLETIRKI